MIKEYFLNAKKWYEERSIRESLFLLGLSFVIIYAIFYLLFFRAIEKDSLQTEAEIKVLKSEIKSWQIQIAALSNIKNSPIYKKWLYEENMVNRLHGKFKSHLRLESLLQWQEVIKTILQSQPNIILVQVKNFPETLLTTENTVPNITKLYEQKLLFVFYSNFLDTVNYIQTLEHLLPNIHWDKITYEVVQYPIAKVEMEFSIFYEKS